MEWECPPPYPGQEYMGAWMDIPNHTELLPELKYWDFRGYTSAAQIDTFCFHIFGVSGNNFKNGQTTLHWPSNLLDFGTQWELKKRQGTSGSNYVTVVSNMETDPDQSWTDINTDHANELKYLIIKHGAYTPENRPVFSLNKSALDFGGVIVGESKTQSVAVTNTGTGSASILGVTSIAGYTITPNPPAVYPLAIAPGASKSFNVTFTPTSMDSFAGNIVFVHNAIGGTMNLAVGGYGISPFTLDMNSIDFGNVIIGDSAIRSVVVTNLSITQSISITG